VAYLLHKQGVIENAPRAFCHCEMYAGSWWNKGESQEVDAFG